MGLFQRTPKRPARPLEVRPPRSTWWWFLPAVLLIGATAWGVTEWLLQDLNTLKVEARVSVRVEAVRSALLAAAGVGGAVTLMLGMRRQRHQELATALHTHDAAERRVTELYAKAVEQLGNDHAPVRLGSLYALERLAQDAPGLRQTIVNVICAYLRMPYTPPRDQDRQEKIRAARRRARDYTPSRADSPATHDPLGERQVRLTAQRILTNHLRSSTRAKRFQRQRASDGDSRHWPNMQLDLVGATLLDFDLSDCRAGDATFAGATFIGDAWFEGVIFTGYAWFAEATFTGDARFSKATFLEGAWFDRVTFSDAARFGEATFSGTARFGGTTGLEKADLRGALVRVADGAVREWPPAWQADVGADGCQTLRLVADSDEGVEEGHAPAGDGPREG